MQEEYFHAFSTRKDVAKLKTLWRFNLVHSLTLQLGEYE